MGRRFLLRLAMVAAVAAMAWVVTRATTDALPAKTPSVTTARIEAVRLDPVTGEVMKRVPEPPPPPPPAPGFGCQLTAGSDEQSAWLNDHTLRDRLPLLFHWPYTEVLATHPGLEGTLTLRWVIGPTGRAEAITVVDNTLGRGGDAFAADIQKLIPRLHYSRRDAGFDPLSTSESAGDPPLITERSSTTVPSPAVMVRFEFISGS